MVVLGCARGGVEHAAGEAARAAEVGLADVAQPSVERGRDLRELEARLAGVAALVDDPDGGDGGQRLRVADEGGERLQAVVHPVVGADHDVGGRRGPRGRDPPAHVGNRQLTGLGGELQPHAAAVDEPVDRPDQPHLLGPVDLGGVDDAPHLVRVRRHQPHPPRARRDELHLDVRRGRPPLPVRGVEAAEVRVGGDGGGRAELHPVPLAPGDAALDAGVEVFGHEQAGADEQAPLRDDAVRGQRRDRSPGSPCPKGPTWLPFSSHGVEARHAGVPVGGPAHHRVLGDDGLRRASTRDRDPAVEPDGVAGRVAREVGRQPLLGDQQPRPRERAAEAGCVGDARRRVGRRRRHPPRRQPAGPAAAARDRGRGTGTRPASRGSPACRAAAPAPWG